MKLISRKSWPVFPVFVRLSKGCSNIEIILVDENGYTKYPFLFTIAWSI
jgi:hypothetical protein